MLTILFIKWYHYEYNGIIMLCTKVVLLTQILVVN